MTSGAERIRLDALGGEAERGSPGSLSDSRRQESKVCIKRFYVSPSTRDEVRDMYKFYSVEPVDLARKLELDIRSQASLGILAFFRVKIGYE